jgi:hypothetical protein
MLSKRNLNIILGTLAALSIATIATASLNENQNLLLATGTDKTMTINGASNLFTSAETLNYTSNYKSAANYPIKTFNGNTFKAAIMNQPTATGTLTVGGGTVISKTTYVKSGSGTSATYQANLYFGIGLNNFKSITSLFTTYPSGQALSAIVVSFFSLDWQKNEYVYRTVVSGSQTFTPTGIDSSTGTTYTPRWAYISASKEKSASLTTDYIALSSLTFTWNC